MKRYVAALRTIVGAPPPVNEQGIWFAFGDTGYVRTSYLPESHLWVIRELVTGRTALDRYDWELGTGAGDS